MPERVLILRLSSFGDVILSLSVLEHLPASWQIDWLTGSEYQDLFANRRRIQRLRVFDRKSSLLSWLRLVRSLSDENYSCIVDLHCNLRTLILRVVLVGTALLRGSAIPRISVLKRQRWRRRIFLIFKKSTPVSLRPVRKRQELRQFCEQHFGIVSATGAGDVEPPREELSVASGSRLSSVGRVGLVPSSAWQGKEWGVEKFAELAMRLIRAGKTPIILGLNTDRAAVALIERLNKNADTEGKFVDGTGKGNLERTRALVLSCERVISGDTGLAHFAESVGVPVTIIFGPTHPDLGFGPALTGSRSVVSPVWCSPCSKDGSQCFRPRQRFLCMQRISVEDVLAAL